MVGLFRLFNQEKVTYGLIYTLMLKQNRNSDPVESTGGAAAGRNDVERTGWYVENIKPDLVNQESAFHKFLDSSTESVLFEKSVFKEYVITNHSKTSELTMSLSGSWKMIASMTEKNLTVKQIITKKILISIR